MTQQLPSLAGPQWHQGQRPRLCPLWLQGPFCLPFVLSWQSFTMSPALHRGMRLLRGLRPPSHTLAFLRPVSRHRGKGVPQFQSIRRIKRPVAACCRPGANGSTYRQSPTVGTRHPPILGQVYQPISPVTLHDLSTQVPCVSIGIRSGRSTPAWLRVAQLLSLGFPPSRVPPRSAGQVDLPPLSRCNRLNRLSLCPVKGRAWRKPWALSLPCESQLTMRRRD
jgi:hypothetical protein